MGRPLFDRRSGRAGAGLQGQACICGLQLATAWDPTHTAARLHFKQSLPLCRPCCASGSAPSTAFPSRHPPWQAPTLLASAQSAPRCPALLCLLRRLPEVFDIIVQVGWGDAGGWGGRGGPPPPTGTRLLLGRLGPERGAALCGPWLGWGLALGAQELRGLGAAHRESERVPHARGSTAPAPPHAADVRAAQEEGLRPATAPAHPRHRRPLGRRRRQRQRQRQQQPLSQRRQRAPFCWRGRHGGRSSGHGVAGA